jgi:hypothetical protein
MEQVINTVASALGNSVAFLAETGVLFVVFAVLWAAFGAALIWSQGSLDAAWQWIRDLPLLLQGLVWLLFLPVAIGLWVWETTWPLIVRLVLIAGLAGWNLLIFLPRALQAGRP